MFFSPHFWLKPKKEFWHRSRFSKVPVQRSENKEKAGEVKIREKLFFFQLFILYFFFSGEKKNDEIPFAVNLSSRGKVLGDKTERRGFLRTFLFVLIFVCLSCLFAVDLSRG